MNPPIRIITLTTDLGTKDGYVAALKGTILSTVSNVRLIDISNNIAPHDIMEAAYVLSRNAPYFPPGTIHLVVVDPAAGKHRCPVGLKFKDQFYIGPDNGLLSLALSDAGPDVIVHLSNEAFWRPDSSGKPSQARDILAPAAAHLANGVALSNLGRPAKSLHPMYWALPIKDQEGIQGWVVHVDRFGNCITNIARDDFNEIQGERGFRCYIGNSVIKVDKIENYSAEPGDPMLLFNSDNILEIAINRDSASSLLDIPKGAPVNIVFGDGKSITSKANGTKCETPIRS